MDDILENVCIYTTKFYTGIILPKFVYTYLFLKQKINKVT